MYFIWSVMKRYEGAYERVYFITKTILCSYVSQAFICASRVPHMTLIMKRCYEARLVIACRFTNSAVRGRGSLSLALSERGSDGMEAPRRL